MWHVWICSKYSISPLSSKIDLKTGTLDTLILNHFSDSFLFSKYNKKVVPRKPLHFLLYYMAKKLSSSFRKTWLNLKIYYKIALTSMKQTMIFWCLLTQFFFYIISSVIRQKTNLKRGISRKQSRSNFPKNEHFLPHDTHTYMYV